ncbi:ABC transporter permease [Natrarchaeobius chitinivorans]|uniref:ABC transporter n=1 Tax=Natrarchaeobius chitinivorans TaxID=1679083 RepID=A0A3N6LWT9_NATCH|nr:ABC transporter permease [Natrarchaeobius chitinivorans]RQG95158.1 ABC transporter [Natrarchaeobius chitinivorans]
MSTETGTTTASGSPSSSINLESIRAIAKKDFQDSFRSWVFWGLSIFFFTLLVASTGIISYFEGDLIAAEGATTVVLIDQVRGLTQLVIPLIALILGWKSVAGERESGSIKILLSLPHSRTDVLIGKLIGRSAVLAVSLTVGFALAAVVVAALIGSFDVGDYLGLLVVSILYGVAYTSLAIAASSMTRSTTIAGAAIFGIFVLFYIIWDTIVTAIYLLMIFDYLPDNETMAQVVLFFQSLDPGTAYATVLSLATSVAEMDDQTVAALEAMFDTVPFYLTDWFALVVLLFWIVVPMAIAIIRFDRTDL